MCTAIWWQQSQQLRLSFNRDEQHSRPDALPPEIHHTTAGTRFLAPIDPPSGGTWILVNEHGLLLCLLNYYSTNTTVQTTPARSRGLILPELADCHAVTEVAEFFSHNRPIEFAPFHLLAFRYDEPALHLCWDGSRLNQESGAAIEQPVTSSSFDTERVLSERRMAAEGKAGGKAGVPCSVFGVPWVTQSDTDWQSVDLKSEITDQRSPNPPPSHLRPKTLSPRLGHLPNTERGTPNTFQPTEHLPFRPPAFSLSRSPINDAYSVLAHRPDARTVSITVVSLEAGLASMAYAPRALGALAPGGFTVATLALAGQDFTA